MLQKLIKPLQNQFMRISILFLLSACCFVSCKQESPKPPTLQPAKTNVTYAQGFTIEHKDTYDLITISNPWPGADRTYTYALAAQGVDVSEAKDLDAVITVPVKKIVVTSTTHIPSLEMLGVENKLAGFPNTNYISSEKTRKLIDNGTIKEVGKNEDLNTEVLIDLQPEAIVTFAIEGSNKALTLMSKTGIPVLYNSDWTEKHPLGKAEWIKFFGALFGKEKEADSIFKNIEKNYNDAKIIASRSEHKPTVLSGAMYKDIWYLPQGDSWAARFIDDANGTYLWRDHTGTGSLSFNLETVLEKGISANYWIGPGQFTTKEQMLEFQPAYGQFEAFKNDNLFSFTTKKGPTGGVLYYELAPNRPDIVLKDIIKILHPELLPDHELFFFSALE